MKRSEILFTVSLVPIDFALVFLAALTAYNLRFGWLADFRPISFDLPLRDFVLLATGAGALAIGFLAMSGLYRIGGPRRLKQELSRVFLASSTTYLAFIVIIFFRRELFSSRFIILAAWLITVVYLSAGRIIVRLAQRWLMKYGIGTRRVVIIGPDERNRRTLVTSFESNPGAGHHIIGVYGSFDAETERELAALTATGALDEIIVADPEMSRAELSRILGFAQSRQIIFKYSADLLETHATNIEIGTLAGIPVVEIKGTRLEGWGRVFKRVFDVIGAILLIIVTSPIMLVTAIAIKLDSRGPVFIRLDDGSPFLRIGEQGLPFHYIKFRSMHFGTHNQRYTTLADRDTRAEGPLVKIKDDPRITRVGKFIRKYSIDELPEFFLVLAGHMSLVGPRPHLPEEVAKYRDDQRRLFSVKPGITGLAQVSGRADLTFDDEVRLDTYYVENWSPWLDLAILAKTPWVVLSKRGAS